MNLSFYFARRYLFAKKSTQVINVISFISVLGVMIGSAALFVILSVFNGFEELNLLYFKKLNPDIVIQKTNEGVFGSADLDPIIQPFRADALQVKSLEQYVLMRYGQNTVYAKLKGVSNEFLTVPGLDSTIVAGSFILQDSLNSYLVLGYGLTQQLGMVLEQTIDQISVFANKSKIQHNAMDPLASVNRRAYFPGGVFSVQQEMDQEQAFMPLDQAQSLFDKTNTINAIELYLNDDADIIEIQEKIAKNLPAEYKVRNRYEMNAMLYKVLNSERWAVYLIMTFILTVAITNIVGAITMLIIDKKKDIEILSSMGMTAKQVQKIFLIQALLIACIGVLLGLGLGTAFVFLQEHYGLITIAGSENFLVQAYPIEFITRDLFWVFGTVMGISFITAWFTAAQSKSLLK